KTYILETSVHDSDPDNVLVCGTLN
ncbi:hypothetical protein, partial [uncultured Gammaproteobacteria bacterium]